LIRTTQNAEDAIQWLAEAEIRQQEITGSSKKIFE
jgi:hypothetical protein